MDEQEQGLQLDKLGHQVLEMIARAVIGKNDQIWKTLLAILARGNILLEDMPGVGKTTLALAFSKALSLDYSRMQFTPDVLPSDITGFSVYNKDTRELEYSPGAIMCNLFLADELNRATSRTQSALLEAMEEGQVTVDGISHPLPQPFMVMATQNPAGAAGTQLLPESQLDRFMLRLTLGYLDHHEEVMLVEKKQKANLLDLVEPVLDSARLEEMRRQVDQVYVHKDLLDYIVTLVGKTRNSPDILVGASPRASIDLTALAKAAAYLCGRDYVIPEDIDPLFTSTLAHRLILQPGYGNDAATADEVLWELLNAVPQPQLR